MPALIPKFTVVDPAIRVSHSLKTSTHRALKQYDLFYKEVYKEEATGSEMLENMALWVIGNDPDFQKYLKRMPPAAQAELEEFMRRLTGRKVAEDPVDA